MFESIIEQIKQKLTGVLQHEHQLGESEAQKTAEAAGRSIIDLVKKQINQKDFSAVDEALSGNPTNPSHPAVQQLIQPVGAKINEQTGMDITKSNGIAATLLPFIFNMFNEQVQQAKTKGLDVPSMVKQLAGGNFNIANMGDVMSLVKSFSKGNDAKAGGGMFSKFF